MIVVDASALAHVLLRMPGADAAKTRLLIEGRGGLHAPHLIDVEVTHVLRRYVAAGEIDSAHGDGAIAILADFPILRHPHARLLARAWELRRNLTAYDAVYVALAEVLDVPLITCDRRLAAAATSHIRVELV